MSKPKNMTPEQEADWRSRENDRRRKWKKENRDKVNASARRSYEKNPRKYCLAVRLFYKRHRDKKLVARRQYYEKNAEKCCLNAKLYHEKNRDVELLRAKKWRANNRENIREYSKKRTAELADNYIKQVLCQETELQFKDIPKNLVSLKREHLKMTRKLKTIDQ